jgi:multiple sugar transport system permease protein
VRLTRRDRIVLFAPLAVLLGGWLVLPAVLGLVATFTTYSPFTTTVRLSGFANYAAVVQDPQFGAAIRNIAVFTAAAVPLELAVGFGIAYLLRRPIKGRALWRVLFLAPWLVSPIAGVVMWHFLFGGATGILDFAFGWLGLPEVASPVGDLRLALPTAIAVEIWRVAPFVTFLLLPGLVSIPNEQWEEATLAGASWIQQIRHVAIPELRTLLLTVAMLLVGLSFGAFDTILILTGGGPGTATLTPALYSYGRAFQTNDWPVGAASGWLVAAGVIAVGAIYLRLARERPAT